MAIQPNSDLFLVKCPLQLSNKHQLTFNSKDEQINYFKSLPKIEVDNISYIRKDNIIRFPGHIDSLLEYNYCFYKNENYSDKWFFAFIVRMEYVNDNCTNIFIKQDTWQTWQFDLVFLKSFIEREMINVSDDIPGANIVPESLEIGEPKVNGTASFDELRQAYIVAFSGSKMGDQVVSQSGYSYNGIPSSVTFILCNNIGALQFCLNGINQVPPYSGEGQGDKIVSVFSIPRLAVQSILDEEEIDEPNTTTYVTKILNYYYKQDEISKTLISTPSSIDRLYTKKSKIKNIPLFIFRF